MSGGLVTLTPREIRQAKAAGFMVAAPSRKNSFFGGMFSWVSGIRFGAMTFWPMGGNARPPVNAATGNTGQTVTPDTALTLSAVWACVWLNARTMASLPLDLKRYAKSGAAALATDEPLYDVLRWKPNTDMAAFDFWTAFWANEQVWGTGYAEILRNGGRVIGLRLLLSQYMTAYQTGSGELRFRYQDPRKPRDFAAADIFRVFTRSLDGLTGASVIEFARHSFGLAQSGELAASKTFKKGLNASGFVTTKKFLTKDQREMFRESIDEFTGDGDNAGGTMVLEGETGYTQLSLKPLDAELLSSRQFSVEEVCRWFGVPPVLVGHAAQGQTMWGSGIEQIFGGWARLSLRPFTVAAVQRVRADLITPAQRPELYAEYDFDELLAPDALARAQLYSSLAQNGIRTRNELREKEGVGPLPGGDLLTCQSNLVPLDQLGKQPAGGGSAAAEKFRNALVEFLELATQPPPPPPAATKETP